MNMAPLHYHHLARRSQAEVNLSIVFGLVAATIVVICVVWSWGVPRIRGRTSPDPYTEQRNDDQVAVRAQSHASRFPTHSAVDPFTSHQTSLPTYDPRSETPFPSLPTYDPRNETPFPNYPENALSSTSSVVWKRTGSAPATTTNSSSNALFTPLRGSAVEGDQVESNIHTVPRGPDTKSFVGKSADFGDTKDFILAVPEPLVLKSRPLGRPPAVTRYLHKQRTPHSNSPASMNNKHLHPNKLFRALQQDNAGDSYCSSNTMRADQGESDPTKDCDAIEMVKMVDKAIAEKERQGQHSRANSVNSSVLETVGAQDQEQSDSNSDLTAMHHLRSYQSLTGSQTPKKTRAGTISRPKTPLNELKRLYGEERSVTVPSVGIPRFGTISTITTGFGPNSENESISTPATSPFRPSHNLSMMPTPLRPRKEMRRSPDIDYPETLNSRPATSHGSQDEHKGGLPALRMASNKRREQRSSRGFYHTGRRQKPAPPNINTDLHTPVDDDWPLRTFLDVNQDISSDNMSKDQPRKFMRASSMYSRDTFGMSLAQTPTTAEGSSPMANLFVEPDAPESSNPFRSRESIKTRISQWNQRIEGQPPTPHLPRIGTISPAVSTASLRDYFEMAKGEEGSSRRFGGHA